VEGNEAVARIENEHIRVLLSRLLDEGGSPSQPAFWRFSAAGFCEAPHIVGVQQDEFKSLRGFSGLGWLRACGHTRCQQKGCQ
jgi:hypothetical protein